MPYNTTPLGIPYPDQNEKYPSATFWRRLAEGVDQVVAPIRIMASKALADSNKAAAAAQAVANASGLTPPDWSVVDTRYLITGRAFVDVTQHGVKGDGVTDDTAALRSVLSQHAGKTLLIPRYANVKATGPLTVPASTTITGGGRLTLSGTTGLMVSDAFVALDDLVIWGPATTAVALDGAGTFVMRRCRVAQHENAVSGFVTSASGGFWRISDNVFSSSVSTGLAINVGGSMAYPLSVELEGNRFGGGYRAPKVAFGYMAADFAPRGNMGALPDTQAATTTAAGRPAPGSAIAYSVTFPRAYVTPPQVVATAMNSRLTVGVSTVTTTGFTGYIGNWSGATVAEAETTFRWIATPGIYS